MKLQNHKPEDFKKEKYSTINHSGTKKVQENSASNRAKKGLK